MVFEDHLLKEPCGMGNIPPWRRNIDDGLRYVVLGLERLAKLLGVSPNPLVKSTKLI